MIFWKLDRLCRSVGDFGTMLAYAQADRSFRHHKLPTPDEPKNLIAATGEIDLGTPAGRAMASVVVVFAQLEADVIAERVNAARDEMRQQGRWFGGPVPWGYVPVPRDGGGFRLEIDPESAPVLRELARRVAGGEPMYAVQLDFESRRIPTPKGGTKGWRSVNVSSILRSRALLGEYTYDDELDDPVRAQPLLSLTEWRSLQEVLSGRERQRRTGAHLLLNVAVCAVCGAPMYLRSMKQKAKDGSSYSYRYLGCGNHWGRRTGGAGCEAKQAVRADVVEEVAADLLLRAVGDVEVMREERIAEVNHAAELAEHSAALADLLAKTEGKPEAVAKVYAARIAYREAEIERLAALPEVAGGTRQVSTGRTYRETWEATPDDDARRQLLLASGVRYGVVKVPRDRFLGAPYEPLMVVRDGVQVSLRIPADLAARVTGDATRKLIVRQKALPGIDLPDRIIGEHV